MMQNLITNWKTTSAGITMIVGAIVHLIFNRHTLTEPVVMMAVGAILAGLGLIFSGDASTTDRAMKQMDERVQNVEGNTAAINATNIPPNRPIVGSDLTPQPPTNP